MTFASFRPSRRCLHPLGVISAPVILIALLISGCTTIRLIADYDEFTFGRTAALQEKCETLFVALENAAATPDPTDDLYPAHATAYDEIVVALRVLETRAASLDKNQITTEQVHLLLDSTEKMQKLHQEKSAGTPPTGFSGDTVKVLREPFVQQFRSILTLQESLKGR